LYLRFENLCAFAKGSLPIPSVFAAFTVVGIPTDATSLCEHVFADVDVFDVREDQCGAVFSRHGVRDIYGFVQLLGGDVMNELVRALGLKWNYLALHAEGTFLDGGGFYLYLNTSSLMQVS
jgi:hypothetical protein